MKINNIDGLTIGELHSEIDNGGKFVFYQYTISVILMTFKRPSDIYFIRANEKSSVKGLQYTLLSAVLGWWGIPWGPIYTIQSLNSNLKGGKDVTQQVMASLIASAPTQPAADTIAR